MSSYRDSIVTDEMRQRMVAFAHTLMSPQLRQRHDPESPAYSAEMSANELKNAHLWDLPPEELIRCLLQKTRIHVMNLVGHERAQKRNMDQEAGPVEDHGELAGGEPDPAVVVEWRDLWDWVRKELAAENAEHASILDLLRQGHSTPEIADKIGYSTRTVERKIKEIHELLRDLLSPKDKA
jgi:hypothetical protein